jgi:proteasome lid subunit RPN8/RPN11
VIVLHTAASIKQIIDHAASNLRAEVGGVLLGKAYQENEHLVVEVQAALPARNDDHGPVHFTFTADAWSQIHRERQADYAGLDIVGWFHTHPGLGVFYSSDDVVVHSAAFTMPWHVGLVVDPLRSEAAYFGWVDGELTPLDGFYEIQRAPNAKKVAPWRVVRTAVWHERQTEEFYASYEQEHGGWNRPIDRRCSKRSWMRRKWRSGPAPALW